LRCIALLDVLVDPVEGARDGLLPEAHLAGAFSSSSLAEGREMDAATGMYDAVKEISHLPHVDTSGSGISGHSNGARAANWAVGLDDTADTPPIKSVYLVDTDPI
jgi:hypothetical protein